MNTKHATILENLLARRSGAFLPEFPVSINAEGKTMDSIECYSDNARGIYIPQHFAETFNTGWSNIDQEDISILKQGPDHELYWDAWTEVLDNAKFEKDGNTWILYQDGDLWCVCLNLMTAEEKDNFGFNE